jgi:hypothetical protein
MEQGRMEDAWLTWAKRLQSIASTGLHFSKDRYDRERYEGIGHIANEMLGRLGSVPIARIESLISDFAKGYATPKVDVRGAVFHDNRILLVREASDGLWAHPVFMTIILIRRARCRRFGGGRAASANSLSGSRICTALMWSQPMRVCKPVQIHRFTTLETLRNFQ